MSLDHAILGFLHYGPLSGYDLKAVFDMSVRHFWPADQSQIYRTLSRLAERGWTAVEVIEQDERPDRKVYHLTAEGEAELHRWLTTPLPQRGERIPELVQIFFAGQLDDDAALAMFRHFAEKLRGFRDALRRVPEENRAQTCRMDEPVRDKFFWELTLEYGMHMTEANLQWMETVIGRIERREHLKGESDEDAGDQR